MAASAGAARSLPKLVVFDLDYTLWPFWIDTHVDPPFQVIPQNGAVFDRVGKIVSHYPAVPEILQWLHQSGVRLAVASRTTETRAVEQLVRLFQWDRFFSYKQIYPGCKVTHFKKINKESGIPFKDMIFFDDEARNISDVSKLGVTCVHVKDGMQDEVLTRGLHEWAAKNT